MTTQFEEKKRCGICGFESEYTGIGSTNRFGSADLDTRPPEMERSTIFAWVQRCPECGYCNNDVSKSPAGAKEVMGGKEYQDQLNDSAYPVLANSFLCDAIICREAGNYAHATWGLIRAAWACDDAGKPEQASTCREKAADMLALAQQHGQKVCSDARAHAAMLVDLLRRSGQAERAKQILATKPQGTDGDVIDLVMSYQGALIARNDVSCHTIAEAQEAK